MTRSKQNVDAPVSAESPLSGLYQRFSVTIATLHASTD